MTGEDRRTDGTDEIDYRWPDGAAEPFPSSTDASADRCWMSPYRPPTGGCGRGTCPSRGFAADDRGRVERRDIAKLLATVGGVAAAGSLLSPLAGFAQVEEGEGGPIYEENVALVDGEGERIQEDRLENGELLTVFPETNPGRADAPTLLVRFPEAEYGGETNLEFTVSGYAAYSKVCTHAGCLVDDREDDVAVCPCHAGKYDLQTGATVVGGPPPRSLPQLPITLAAEGYLVAAGTFPTPVGPGVV